MTAINAAVINYDESADGDLSDLGFTYVGTLGLGTNTVSGSTYFRTPGDPDSDVDNFAFSVPPGAVLDGISYAFTLRPTGDLLVASTDYWFLPAMLSGERADFLAATSPLSMTFGGIFPVPEGDYEISQIMASRLCESEDCGWDVDYTWSLTVTAQQIPEPSSSLLILAALLGGAFVRRELVQRRTPC